MNQDNSSNEISKFKYKIQGTEQQAREHGETNMTYTLHNITRLIESGHIPKDLGEWHIQQVEEQNRINLEWKKSFKDDPDIPQVDRVNLFIGEFKVLSQEEYLSNMVRHGEMHNLLAMLQKKGLLNQDDNSDCQLLQVDGYRPIPKVNEGSFAAIRLIADPLNNLYKINQPPVPKYLQSEGVYVTVPECNNSKGDTIKLEYRFRASSQKEANIQVRYWWKRVMTSQKKAYQACWALASEKGIRGPIKAKLTDLMIRASPERTKDSFRSEEKARFYQDLFDVQQTPINFIKKDQPNDTLILPFITVHRKGECNPLSDKVSERYPNEITYSVLDNPLYENEALYHIAAGITRGSLGLNKADVHFNQWISVRKNQLMDSTHIIFQEKDAQQLYLVAGVSKIENKRMRNKRLLEKLHRLKKVDTIISVPLRVIFPFKIQIRETPSKK